MGVIGYAKQKHFGCKKCEANQLQYCKQASATKSFDISWGQEVTLSKIFLTPWMTYKHIFMTRLVYFEWLTSLISWTLYAHDISDVRVRIIL